MHAVCRSSPLLPAAKQDAESLGGCGHDLSLAFLWSAPCALRKLYWMSLILMFPVFLLFTTRRRYCFTRLSICTQPHTPSRRYAFP